MALAKKEVKTAILGGGLAGLTLANYLEKAGVEYFLVEGTPEFGGLARGQKENGVELDFGLKSIPVHGELDQNPLMRLKNDLQLSSAIECDNTPAQVYEKNEFMPFTGFGDVKARDVVEELSYYLQSPRLWISGGWQNLVRELSERIPIRRKINRSQVIRLEVQDGRITAAHINGDSVLYAENFIWALPPQKLLELFTPQNLSQKTTKTLTKAGPLTVLSLDLVTPTSITDNKSPILLKNSGEEEFFTVGRFVSNVDLQRQRGGGQLSSWLSLVDVEQAESEEEVSRLIKMMKRFIWKAFPELNANKPWERIIVAPEALGALKLPLNSEGRLPEFENLWFVGSFAHQEGLRHIPAALSSSIQLASKFQGDTAVLKASSTMEAEAVAE